MLNLKSTWTGITMLILAILLASCSDPHSPEEYVSMVQKQGLRGLEGQTIGDIMQRVGGESLEWKFFKNAEARGNIESDPPIIESSRIVTATWKSGTGESIEVMFKVDKDAKPEENQVLFELAKVQIANEAYYGKTALTIVNQAAGGTYDEAYDISDKVFALDQMPQGLYQYFSGVLFTEDRLDGVKMYMTLSPGKEAAEAIMKVGNDKGMSSYSETPIYYAGESDGSGGSWSMFLSMDDEGAYQPFFMKKEYGAILTRYSLTEGDKRRWNMRYDPVAQIDRTAYSPANNANDSIDAFQKELLKYSYLADMQTSYGKDCFDVVDFTSDAEGNLSLTMSMVRPSAAERVPGRIVNSGTPLEAVNLNGQTWYRFTLFGNTTTTIFAVRFVGGKLHLLNDNGSLAQYEIVKKHPYIFL